MRPGESGDAIRRLGGHLRERSRMSPETLTPSAARLDRLELLRLGGEVRTEDRFERAVSREKLVVLMAEIFEPGSVVVIKVEDIELPADCRSARRCRVLGRVPPQARSEPKDVLKRAVAGFPCLPI
jgi:hypothetical protein